jgi:hypothetical protein
VGETHRDDGMKFDQEIHEIQKVINQGPPTMKWAPSSHHGGHLASSLGHPVPLCASSPRALSTVRFEPNTLYSHMFRFLFQNHMIKIILNMRKDYISHNLRIDSHNTFPKSHANVGNLFLGTHVT